MKDIFFEGRIYVGVDAEDFFPMADMGSRLKLLTSYPVTGSHNFTNGQDVSGLFELKYQINSHNVCYYDTSKDIFERFVGAKQIVAVPTPPTPSTKGLEEEAKGVVERFRIGLDSTWNYCGNAKYAALTYCDLMIEKLKNGAGIFCGEVHINHYTDLKQVIQNL